MTVKDGRRMSVDTLLRLPLDRHLREGYEMLEHESTEEVLYRPATERTVVNTEESRLIRRLREEQKYK